MSIQTGTMVAFWPISVDVYISLSTWGSWVYIKVFIKGKAWRHSVRAHSEKGIVTTQFLKNRPVSRHEDTKNPVVANEADLWPQYQALLFTLFTPFSVPLRYSVMYLRLSSSTVPSQRALLKCFGHPAWVANPGFGALFHYPPYRVSFHLSRSFS